MTSSPRRLALAAAIADTADAFLITKLVNVRYLTGFTGSTAAALVRRDGATILATDGRYATQAAGECPDVELLQTRRMAAALVERAQQDGLRRLALERHHVTLAAYDVLRDAASGEVEFGDG